MGSEPLLPESTSQTNSQRQKIRPEEDIAGCCCCCLLVIVGVIGLVFLFKQAEKTSKEAKLYVPNITLQSMDFTVLNVTDETPLSVKWDLLIRIPRYFPGDYMCLKGYFQVLILYKGATIATSSMESYKFYSRMWPQQLNVSTIASEEDMDNGTVKDIMAAIIKNKGKIQFGSQVILPDCRYGTNGKMKYACDEANLQFCSQRNAILFGKHPTCVYIR